MAKCGKAGCPGKSKCRKAACKGHTKMTVKGKAPKKAAKAPRKRGY